MNLVKKSLLIISLFLLIINIVIANTYKVEALTLKEMQNKTQKFLETGKTESSSIETDGIFDDLVDMGSILTTIGAGVLVAVTLYMGIRFITATPEAQAKLKQQLIGLVVAGFVIFGAYFIWKIVINIVEKF